MALGSPLVLPETAKPGGNAVGVGVVAGGGGPTNWLTTPHPKRKGMTKPITDEIRAPLFGIRSFREQRTSVLFEQRVERSGELAVI